MPDDEVPPTQPSTHPSVATDAEIAFESRQIGMGEHLILSAYWFGSNFVWGALLGVVNASLMATLSPGHEARLVGYLSLLGAFPALVIPLVAGAMSDRCMSKWGRRRPYMFAGGVLAVLGLLGLMAANSAGSVELYFAAFFVVQFGANTALAAYSGIIPDIVPHHEHGTASGYMAGMSQASTLLGLLLAAFFIGSHPSTVFIVMIVVFVLFLAISLVGIKETPLQETPAPFDWLAYLKSLWIDPRKYPDFAWVWITRALMMLGFYAVQPIILFYLRDIIHVKEPAKQGGFIFVVILAAATVSGLLGGWISDKVGRKPVVYAASIAMGLIIPCFIFFNSLTEVLIAGVLFGAGYGAYISVDWALGTDVLPNKEDAAKDMGVWHVSMTLPQMIAPFVAGLLLQRSLLVAPPTPGSHIHYGQTGYAIVFCLAALCFIFGGILLRNVRSVK